MALTIDEQLDSLASTISAARWHFHVWEALQEACSDEVSVKTMNRYLEFFRSTVVAHFESYVIACYQLCETRGDTVNFRTLKKALLDIEGRNIDAEPNLTNIQEKLKQLWIKIGRLRNGVIGHTSREIDQGEIFAKAEISAQEVELFMNLAMELHRNITYPRNQSREAFNIDGKPSTRQLLADLAKQS